MKKLFGFTLSELMIALTVLGILCATVAPAIVKTLPNQNKIMIKKAYYSTANIVSDIINNPDFYPVNPDYSNPLSDLSSVTYQGKTYSGHTKFIDLFADTLNTDGEISDECLPKKTDNTPTVSPGGGGNRTYCRVFTTPDGMVWELSTYYKLEMNILSNSLMVDVNGNKKPNCYQGDSEPNEACKKRDSDFDRFHIQITSDGQLIIPENETWAREAIKVGSSLTGSN